VVIVRQGVETTELVNKTLDRSHQFAEKFSLDPVALKLKDGPAEFIIQAWDDSAWKNRIVVVRPFVVDTEKPQIDIIWSSNSIKEQGTGVAIFKASDANLLATGVQLPDGTLFPGVLASGVDSAFTDPNLYVSFFTVPKSDIRKLKAVALDVGNNTVATELSTTVERRYASSDQRLVFSKDAITTLARELFTSLAGDLKGFDSARVESLLKTSQRGERSAEVTMVKALVQEGRPEYLRKIRELLKAGAREPRRWTRPGILAGPPSKIKFGDRVTLADPSGDIVSWSSEGAELESYTGGESVVAPFTGVIRFAQNLGVYGNTIVIDHGAGIASLYYSLGAIHVDWGGRVELGQRIGQIGSSGFNFGRQTRYMMLVHGYPVDPVDWVDPQRYAEVIEGALSGAKQRLGLPLNKKGAPL
jgi:hypothetical protein